jgi:hypothetical protein
VKKTLSLVFLALIVTLVSAVYQRLTGPTHPARFTVEVEGNSYKVRLARSAETSGPAEVHLRGMASVDVAATLQYRRLGLEEPWTPVPFAAVQEDLVALIPPLPAAAKVMYFVELQNRVTGEALRESLGSADDPVVLRFRGHVPPSILIPHIVLMFSAMLLSSWAALEALMFARYHRRLAWVATGCLLGGGFVLGPMVQKAAFDAYWTGWPYGMDLTDNKTLIALIGWVVALVMTKTRWDRVGVVLAAVVMLGVFMIPHSMRGSTLDYKSGQVISR